MEYLNKFPLQENRFAAQVRYFNDEEIEKLFKRLLDDYYEYTFNEDTTWTKDERDSHRLAAKTAFETFTALFCEYEGFQSPGEATAHLKEFYEDYTDADAASTLIRWCAELLKNKATANGEAVEYFERDTVEEFRADIDPFISSAARNGAAAMWPIVKKVSYGTYCPCFCVISADRDSIGVVWRF